jgi:hypothetical protein
MKGNYLGDNQRDGKWEMTGWWGLNMIEIQVIKHNETYQIELLGKRGAEGWWLRVRWMGWIWSKYLICMNKISQWIPFVKLIYVNKVFKKKTGYR